MNQNQNNSSTIITDEQILLITNMLRNGLGIQQTQANLDKGQGWSRSETVGRNPSQCTRKIVSTFTRQMI